MGKQTQPTRKNQHNHSLENTISSLEDLELDHNRLTSTEAIEHFH